MFLQIQLPTSFVGSWDTGIHMFTWTNIDKACSCMASQDVSRHADVSETVCWCQTEATCLECVERPSSKEALSLRRASWWNSEVAWSCSRCLTHSFHTTLLLDTGDSNYAHRVDKLSCRVTAPHWSPVWYTMINPAVIFMSYTVWNNLLDANGTTCLVFR